MKALRLLLAGGGFLVLGYLLGELGIEGLLRDLDRVKWAAPLLLLPSCLWHLSNTVAWGLAFSPGPYRPGLGTLFMAKLAGEAVNQLTPLANIGGEPLKAYLLRHRTPGPLGAATVVIDKTAQLIVGLLFTVAGLALLLAYQERSFPVPVMQTAALAAALLTGAAGLWWYHRRQDRLFTSLLTYLRSAGLMVEVIERNMGRAERIDAGIRAFHGRHRRRFLAVVLFEGIGWFLGTVETYVVLRALSSGFDLKFCFLLTTLGSIVNALFFFMPSNFGVMEGGQVVLFSLLGLDPGMGLSLALIKRFRRLLWVAVGWVFLTRLGAGGAGDGDLTGPRRAGAGRAAGRGLATALRGLLVAALLALATAGESAAAAGRADDNGPGGAAAAGYLVLEDFSSSLPGGVPRDWKWRHKDDDKPKDYIVREAGTRRYVAARDSGLSVVLLKPVAWTPREYPIMTWCWKALALPPGGDERYTETNDSAAGVYVIFSRNWVGIPRQIKYVWSTTLPVGTVARRKGFARPWFVVLESGAERLGRWTMEQVDLAHDHGQILKRDLPKSTLAIGMLTDGNSTGSLAAAAYADFRVWRREAAEAGGIEDYCACLEEPVSDVPAPGADRAADP